MSPLSKVLSPPGTKEYFYRTLATLALVVVGGLAWFGLHRDIQTTANPCVTATPDVACTKYICHIGDVLGLKESPTCFAYDKGKFPLKP